MDNNQQTKDFLKKIKSMENVDLMLAYKNRSDYVPEFVELLVEEINIRGYPATEIDAMSLENTDAIKSKKSDYFAANQTITKTLKIIGIVLLSILFLVLLFFSIVDFSLNPVSSESIIRFFGIGICVIIFNDGYANFTGRTSRKEFWLFCLFITLFVIFLRTIGYPNLLSSRELLIIELAILISITATMVRRLHDTGISGWWLLTALPFYIYIQYVGFIEGYYGYDAFDIGYEIGYTIIYEFVGVLGIFAFYAIILGSTGSTIWLLVRCCYKSQSGENKWGANPKEIT